MRPWRRCCIGFATGAWALAGSPAQPSLEQARSLARAGDFRAAAQFYRQAIAQDAGLIAAWRELGECLHAQGAEGEAMKAWETLLRITPEDIQTLNLVADVHRAQRAFALAIPLYQHSLKIEPRQPSVRTRLAECLEERGDLPSAALIYDALLQEDPGNAVFLARRARVHELQGQLQAAVDLLAGARARRPALAKDLDPRLAHLYLVMGDQDFRAGDLTAARNAYTAGLGLVPDQPGLLAGLGWTCRRGGDAAGAIRHWERAVAGAGTASPALLHALAEAHMELGHLLEARTWFDHARQQAPEQPATWLGLAEVQFREGDPGPAGQALQTLLTLPGIEATWADRAAELSLKYQDSEASLALFRALAPGNPCRNRGLSRIYAGQAASAFEDGRAEEAIRLDRSALEVEPGNPRALRDLGWVYGKTGDWAQSASVLRDLVSRYPDQADAHDLLAQALGNGGHPREALEQERQALALDPRTKGGRLRLLRYLVQDGQMSAARELAVELHREDPDDLTVLYRYAEISTRLQDHAMASQLWDRIRQLDSGSVHPVQRWVLEAYAAEDYDAALAGAVRLAQASPAPEEVLRFLAMDAEALGDQELALTWLRRLTQDYPGTTEHWVHLQIQLIQMGRLEDNLAAIQEGVRLNPDSVTLQAGLAGALLELKRYREALALYRRLAAENPDNTQIYQGLLNSLAASGDFADVLKGVRSSQAIALINGLELRWREGRALAQNGQFQEAEERWKALVRPPAGQHVLPILLYHGVLPQRRGAGINTAQLANQFEALSRAGYTPIFLSELDRMISGDLPWPGKPICITFDDARTDSFTQADPILERLHFKATMMVPTAESVEGDDLFHASWKSIAGFAATGRWEMQGHGYMSHRRIQLDAEGRTGVFLMDRKWLPDQDRVETDQEFQARVDGDYRHCREMLEERFPRTPVKFFAFPFNEAGQHSSGSVAHAAQVNTEIWPKYFRYGMVQDQGGYNLIQEGQGQTPRLLWRFEPDRAWNGETLVRVLEANDPRNAARLELAVDHLDQGYRDRARADLNTLAAEVPALNAKCQLELAKLAWYGERPREAAAHLEAALQASGGQSLDPTRAVLLEPSLEGRLKWENQPWAAVGGTWMSGSDHRDSSLVSTSFRYPLSRPVDLGLTLDRSAYAEPDLPTVYAKGLEGSADWAPNPSWRAAGKLRAQQLSGDPSLTTADRQTRVYGNLELTWNCDRHQVAAATGRAPASTDAALRAGIDQRPVSLNYAYRRASAEASSGATSVAMADGNRVAYQNLQGALWRAGAPDWRYGATVQHADSRFPATAYYTPLQYWAAGPQITYQHVAFDGSVIAAQAMVGRSKDGVNGGRWVSLGKLDWTRMWTQSFRTRLDVELNTETGYRSRQGGLTLQWRF